MIREFDRGEQFASDWVIRHPVFDVRDSPRSLLKIGAFRAHFAHFAAALGLPIVTHGYHMAVEFLSSQKEKAQSRE
jgi:hypothetical protein